MAGILRDGFDSYTGNNAPVGLGSKWTLVSVSGTTSYPSGRFGGQALEVGDGINVVVSKTLDSSVSSLTIHAGIQFLSLTSTLVRPSILLMNGATFTFGLAFINTGEIIAYRATSDTAGTELGRSAALTVTTGLWYSIAIEVVISDASGRVSVYLDGTQVLNLTSVDTNNAVGTVDTLRLTRTGSGTTDYLIDDLYVTDSATRLTNHPRIQTLVPNSDGGTLNLVPSTGTSHFAVVDELPASATDYLSGTTVGDLDILGLTDLTAAPDSIEEVNIVGFLQKTDAGARQMELGVISGGTTSAGTGYSLNSSGLRHDRPLATDPNTSSAWTATNVNALQLRPRVSV